MYQEKNNGNKRKPTILRKKRNLEEMINDGNDDEHYYQSLPLLKKRILKKRKLNKPQIKPQNHTFLSCVDRLTSFSLDQIPQSKDIAISNINNNNNDNSQQKECRSFLALPVWTKTVDDIYSDFVNISLGQN